MDEMVEEGGTNVVNPKIDDDGEERDRVTTSQPAAVRNGSFPKDIRLVSVASVIQPNQQSVIQSTNLNTVQLAKGNVILVNKSGGVIQAASQGLQAVQVMPKPGSDQKIEYLQLVEADEFDTLDDPKKRREILARRPSYRKIYNDLSTTDVANDPEKRRELLARQPSYRKILNDLGAGDVAEEKSADSPTTSESSQETESNPSAAQNTYSPLLKVIPAGSITLTSTEGGLTTTGGLQTLTMTSAGSTGGAIVHYAHAQDGNQFIVPDDRYHSAVTEDAQQKRELRLVKNREAARECRRKKKEYIKCLESRVAVLENQNKALIEELKGLKELYCEKQG